MRLPDAWIEEHCRSLFPDAFGKTATEALQVKLSCSSDVLARAEVSDSDIESDLGAGMAVISKDEGETYVISGSRFRLTVRPSRGRKTGTLMARVTSIRPSMLSRRHEMLKPSKVSLEPLYREAECDLPSLAKIFSADMAAVRRRTDLRDRVRRQLSSGRAPAAPASLHLRAEVNRTYSPLLALFKVLKVRVMSEHRRSVKAVVVDNSNDEIVVSLPPGSRAFDQRTAVQLIKDGGAQFGRIDDADNDADSSRLTIKVARAGLQRGTPVVIEQVPRFAMHANMQALRQLIATDVVGNWDYLSLLMCRPEALPAAGREELSSFFLEKRDNFRFNAEQRDAIAGAVSTPHAFFIKGPPGTGKTSVIAETVLQLIARGERVLLLAPMHVALDEVLEGISGEPGVFPIRMSWAESKVRDNLQKFLPDRVASTYLQNARTPSASQSDMWRSELVQIQPLHAAIAAYTDAKRRHQDHLLTLARGSDDLESSQVAYGRLVAAMTETLAQEFAEHREIQEQILKCEQALSNLHDDLSALTSGQHGGVMSLMYERGQRRQEIRRVERRLKDLRSRGDVLAIRGSAREQHLFDLAGAEADRRAAFAAALIAAEAGVGAAERDVSEARAELAELVGYDPETSSDDHWTREEKDLGGRLQTLTTFIDLEQRWFELSGLGSQSTTGQLLSQLETELRQAANVVCATTTGAASTYLDNVDFDTLIIDEASRVIDSEFLIGANHARRWIMVGDERQLPPYVESADEHHLHALSASRLVDRHLATNLADAVDQLSRLWHDGEELHAFRRESVLAVAEQLQSSPAWPKHRRTFAAAARLAGPGDRSEKRLLQLLHKHLVQSLFERCVARAPTQFVTELSAQHRMIEPIASLVNEPIYGGAYITPAADQLQFTPIEPFTVPAFGAPVVFIDTSASGERAHDMAEGSGFVNRLEAEWAAQVCAILENELQQRGGGPLTVSVLTFYKRQAQLIREHLGHPRFAAFHALTFDVVGVVDSIQGQQSDLVILSFCRATTRRRLPSGYGRWLQDVRRLNVALTRARRGLIMIGHRPTLTNLRGVPTAEHLYRHLFTSLDTRRDVMSAVQDV